MGNVIMKAQQITYGASNVEKALDDLKAPELIELNKRMAAIDEWKANVHEVTYTGSELTINNALALPARSLITEINAIQDLHGYDKPWAGGAGKNKWPFGDFTGTYSNVPFTLAAGTYTVSKANHDVNCGLRFFYADDTSVAFTFFTSETFTLTADVVKINYSSADATTENFMIESGSTATSFAPYSNICPISGRNSVVVTRSDGDEISDDFTIQLGTTVYGADINWDTGVMTVDRGYNTFDGSSSTGWSYVTDYGSVSRFDCTTVVGKAGGNVISNYLKGGNDTSIIPNEEHAYLHGSYGYLIICVETSRLATKDVAGLMSYLESNPLQVCYELATTTTIQLTPEQLELLKGYNRVTIDNGSIELKALVLGGDN